MSLQTIPTELLTQILRNVTKSGDRYNCLLVCRRWYSITKSIIYRHLNVPFLSHNRLKTLVRAIRRYPDIGTCARTICLGDDPHDPKHSLEHTIGGNDINKLWPNITKIELFAMTFERSMLYRFLAYCSRAEHLEELVLHYPDIIPLMQPIGKLKRLTWSVTSIASASVFGQRAMQMETEWLQLKFLESLGVYCPELEELTLGSVSRHAEQPIIDRMSTERGPSDLVAPPLPRLPKLRKFRWEVVDYTVADWKTMPKVVLETHGSQLEELGWAFANEVVDLVMFGEDVSFDLSNLKVLDLDIKSSYQLLTTGKPSDILYENSGTIWAVKEEIEKALRGNRWNLRALKELNIKVWVEGHNNGKEIEIFQQLGQLRNLSKLTWKNAIPMFGWDEAQVVFEKGWHHDKNEMVSWLNFPPGSPRLLTVQRLT